MTLIKQAGGAVAAQTYRVSMPLATHWEPATCEDVDCPQFLHGWKTVLPKDHELIPTLKASGRTYTSERVEGDLVEFVFPPGQPCFRASQHRAQTDRPAIYLHGPRDIPRDLKSVGQGEWHERFVETMATLAGE